MSKTTSSHALLPTTETVISPLLMLASSIFSNFIVIELPALGDHTFSLIWFLTARSAIGFVVVITLPAQTSPAPFVTFPTVAEAFPFASGLAITSLLVPPKLINTLLSKLSKSIGKSVFVNIVTVSTFWVVAAPPLNAITFTS